MRETINPLPISNLFQLDNPERELANAGKYPNIRLFQSAFSYSNELQSEAHIARNWEQPSRGWYHLRIIPRNYL